MNAHRLACLLVLFALPMAATAQPAPEVAAESQWAQRLAQLQSEIEAERSALSALRNEATATQRDLRNQRDQLAQQVVAAQLQGLELERQAAELQNELRAQEPERAKLLAAWASATRAASGLGEQLSVYLSEIPAADELENQVRAAIASIQTDADAGQGLVQLLAALNQVDQTAQQLSVTPAKIRTVTGELEQVQLLSIGHLQFAYLTEGGRVGLTLRSPADASGFRWTQTLSGATRDRLQEVIEQVAAGEQGVAAVPMDVTGQMRVEALVDSEGFGGTVRAGGPVMYPLLLVALLAAGLLLERFWTLYIRNGSDATLADQVMREARAGRQTEALKLAESRQDTVGRTLAALLRRRTAGQHAMEDSVQEQLLQELPHLQRFLGGIGILAAVAPLLGLLGTVTGIIDTFGVIRAVGSAQPGLMAGGISEALITTATGLVIAIPILVLLGVMRGRVDRIISEAERQAATLLNAMTHDAEPAASAAAAEEQAHA